MKFFQTLCAAVLLSGCADFGAPIGGGEPKLSPQEQRLQAIEQRLADVARRLENIHAAGQSSGTGRLEAEVRGLRGEVEKMRHDLESSEKRSRDLYQDIDRRLQRVENERGARLSMEPKIATPPPVPPSQEEEGAYLATFEKLKAGRYDEAIAGFRDLLGRWPDGRYADNAWYWMGESHYVKRDYDAALEAFASLREKFPASPKAPDALLKIGLAQVEKKQKDAARGTFQKVVADYPTSNAATVARQRLEQLK